MRADLDLLEPYQAPTDRDRPRWTVTRHEHLTRLLEDSHATLADLEANRPSFLCLAAPVMCRIVQVMSRLGMAFHDEAPTTDEALEPEDFGVSALDAEVVLGASIFGTWESPGTARTRHKHHAGKKVA